MGVRNIHLSLSLGWHSLCLGDSPGSGYPIGSTASGESSCSIHQVDFEAFIGREFHRGLLPTAILLVALLIPFTALPFARESRNTVLGAASGNGSRHGATRLATWQE